MLSQGKRRLRSIFFDDLRGLPYLDQTVFGGGGKQMLLAGLKGDEVCYDVKMSSVLLMLLESLVVAGFAEGCNQCIALLLDYSRRSNRYDS